MLRKHYKSFKKNINGNRFAKCAIQTALIRHSGTTFRFAIKRSPRWPLTRHVFQFFGYLASGNTEKDIAEAQKMVAAKRHNTFKLKIGSRPVEKMLNMC